MLPPPEHHQPRPQDRESAEPSENVQPMPLLAAAVAVVMVLFGAGYLLFSDPFGDPQLGDRRTVADLMAKAPGTAASGQTADGPALFAAQCVACHQGNGKGLAGVFPPLDNSEWVQGSDKVLINILLYGISGDIEVAGAPYKGLMPAFSQLTDAELAATLTHIRSQWSNKAAPVTAAQVAGERGTSQRTTPFSGGAELKTLLGSAGNTPTSAPALPAASASAPVPATR